MTDNQELHWRHFRMDTWEEDISLNHNNVKPFNNRPSPAEIRAEEFKLGPYLREELLVGKSLAEYAAVDKYPIPSEADREGYCVGKDANYYVFGLADYLKLCAAAKKYDIDFNSYYDFGCSSGRVLRHFCAQSNLSELWGSDINGRHIQWLDNYLPRKVKIIHHSCIPHIPIADHSMDIVSAFSVFTHIDTFETAWLAEIYRVLKPGGLCYLTVHNDDTWKFLQEDDDRRHLLNHFKKTRPDFGELLKEDIPEGRMCFRYTDRGPYRALVTHSNEYLRGTWGRYFEILEIEGKAHGRHQAVLIGKKP